MIDWQTWRMAWSEWATEWSGGLVVIWAKQETNAPVPSRPYVLLDVLGVAKAGGEDGLVAVFDEAAENGKQFTQTQYGTRRVRLNVQVFAKSTGLLEESALAQAQSLADSLDNPQALAPLVVAGLGVERIGDVLDLTGIEHSQFGGRASFDATFAGAAVKAKAVTGQWIQRAIGEGDVEGNSSPEITFDVDTGE